MYCFVLLVKNSILIVYISSARSTSRNGQI